MDTPDIGARVAWVETYFSAGNVLQDRLVWGEVLSVFDHPGSRDGFSIKGTYAEIKRLDDSIVFVMIDDIFTIQNS
jgi:hypothetical protein